MTNSYNIIMSNENIPIIFIRRNSDNQIYAIKTDTQFYNTDIWKRVSVTLDEMEDAINNPTSDIHSEYKDAMIEAIEIVSDWGEW